MSKLTYIQAYVQVKRQVNICTSEMCNKLVIFVFKPGMNTCNNGMHVNAVCKHTTLLNEYET